MISICARHAFEPRRWPLYCSRSSRPVQVQTHTSRWPEAVPQDRRWRLGRRRCRARRRSPALLSRTAGSRVCPSRQCPAPASGPDAVTRRTSRRRGQARARPGRRRCDAQGARPSRLRRPAPWSARTTRPGQGACPPAGERLRLARTRRPRRRPPRWPAPVTAPVPRQPACPADTASRYRPPPQKRRYGKAGHQDPVRSPIQDASQRLAQPFLPTQQAQTLGMGSFRPDRRPGAACRRAGTRYTSRMNRVAGLSLASVSGRAYFCWSSCWPLPRRVK
jgi:hypothetical protein